MSPPRDPRPSFAPVTFLLMLAVLLVAGLVSSGCDKKHTLAAFNQPPSVTLTNGPVDTSSTPQSWIVVMAWVGSDPDGSIDHFEYAIDPPTQHQARFALQETTWVSTHDHAVVVRFRAANPDSLGPGATASEFHTFALRAMDDRGAYSPLLVRAFYARTVAPDVQITRPVPTPLLQVQVPVPFRLEWAGDDPDGEASRRPTGYRFRLLDLNDPDNQRFLLDPDSLFKLGIATGWADWRFIRGDTTSLVLSTANGLVPGKSFLAVVLAVDGAGATTPYVDFNRNALRFSVESPAISGPRIHVSSPLIDFTYPTGGYFNDSLHEIAVSASVTQSLEFRWDGIPAAGRVVQSSRWKLGGDPFDESPGQPLEGHWSLLGSPAGGAQLNFLSEGIHRLFIEMRDDFGERSLGIVRIEVFNVTATSELLVVDDTRLEPDRFGASGLLNYTRRWPSSSELDTFLFARGGVPWRQAKNPAGALSTPGLLTGYEFDTLGTQRGLEDPATAVRLSDLARYRHVLWLVDDAAATASLPVGSTALRAMSAPGRASALAGYVAGGGRVWLAGGGAAYASLINFNSRMNDAGGVLFTFEDGELGVGRTMYDHAHVRSALGVALLTSEPQRSSAALGGWSGQGPDGSLSAPDYSKLPAALRFRTPATDPIPPTRLSSQGSLYYVASATYEFVAAANTVTESAQPEFPDANVRSTLDTLYDQPAALIRGFPTPVMLYYHGRDNVPYVFSGFAPWAFARADAQALVDFVLGDIWGLPRVGPRAAAVRVGTAQAVVRQTGAVRAPTRRLDPPRARH